MDVDCNGECGGDAVADCAGNCGGDAVIDDCGVCGGDGSSCATSTVDVTYNSDEAIAGFQFNHDGCLTDPYAQGGDAGAAGFTISGGVSTVLAFSFTGAVVPTGSGTLVELEET